MKKGILVIVVLVLLGGVGAYFYVFNKPHRDPSSETASYQISAEEIVSDFRNNQEAANEKYVDKVVEVSGTAMEITDSYIIMDNVLNCTILTGHDVSGIQAGDEITIKGRVIAFDDLLEEVKMDNCIKL
ncbi:OB-fold protein [Owenweeksia hongkongensis]|uniref:OB-fold protein n=1 Tax=Owenweeksia hongkongensis TaxID=253245 RepID=UPI003A91D8F2